MGVWLVVGGVGCRFFLRGVFFPLATRGLGEDVLPPAATVTRRESDERPGGGKKEQSGEKKHLTRRRSIGSLTDPAAKRQETPEGLSETE